MKILLINKFLYPVGGDATCTLSTGELLRSRGHQVVFWGMSHPDNPPYPTESFFVENVEYKGKLGLLSQIKMAARLLYSLEAKDKVRKLIEAEKPDIVHLNNFAHQISPSVLHVFKEFNIPVVMTLMDYKVVCPTYLMLADGKPCELCKGGQFYHCLTNKCTMGSYPRSMLNAVEMYLHHKMMNIYDIIDIYIASSNFLKEKVIEMGLRGKVVKLFNFVESAVYWPAFDWQEESVIYVGRISREKGVKTMIDAFSTIPLKLKIVGDGTERAALEKYVADAGYGNIAFLGYRKGKELEGEIRKSMFAVAPSEWYENNPRAVIEAFAFGKPVVGSRIGGIPEMVIDGKTGLLFTPGDSGDLRSKVMSLIGNHDSIKRMGQQARSFLEEELDSEKHYNSLMQIYGDALERN